MQTAATAAAAAAAHFLPLVYYALRLLHAARRTGRQAFLWERITAKDTAEGSAKGAAKGTAEGPAKAAGKGTAEGSAKGTAEGSAKGAAKGAARPCLPRALAPLPPLCCCSRSRPVTLSNKCQRSNRKHFKLKRMTVVHVQMHDMFSCTHRCMASMPHV